MVGGKGHLLWQLQSWTKMFLNGEASSLPTVKPKGTLTPTGCQHRVGSKALGSPTCIPAPVSLGQGHEAVSSFSGSDCRAPLLPILPAP